MLTHRSRRAAPLLVMILALVGCAAVEAEAPSPVPTSSLPQSAAPASTPAAPTEGPVEDDMAGWQTIRLESGRTQFQIPRDWSAEIRYEEMDSDPVDAATVHRPDGQQQLVFSHAPGDVGGICEPSAELLETAPTALVNPVTSSQSEPTFAAVAVELEDGRWSFGMGITEASSLEEPLGCPFRFMVGGPGEPEGPGGILHFGTETELGPVGGDPLWIVESREAATDYLETEEYATLRQILLSLEYLI